MLLPARISRVPLMLISFKGAERLGRRFSGLGKVLIKIRPTLKKEFISLGVDLNPRAYMVGAFFSGFLYGLLFFGLGIILLAIRGEHDDLTVMKLSAAVGLMISMLFFLLHIIYPGILVKKIAAQEDKDLLYALREIMTEVQGGVPLFDAMKEVSRGDYGIVSLDFAYIVAKIESGIPMKEALRELALTTESEFLRRALWQMINALETGASMAKAIPSVVQALEGNMIRSIRNYSSNLNFLMLIYMLIAASVPSLGITFLVLLSAFSGMGVTITTVAMLVGGSMIGQLALIGYMRSTRPEVFGG